MPVLDSAGPLADIAPMAGRLRSDLSRKGGWRGAPARLMAVLGLAVLLSLAGRWLIGWLGAEVEGVGAHGAALLIALVAGYALLLAVPFVPGVELGLALLMMEGGRIAPAIYAATVAGLMLAFLIGLWLPDRVLVRAFEALRLHRAARLAGELEPLDRGARIARLEAQLPRRIGPIALRHRYLVLAVLINLPGSGLIGGGGGIAMVAGLSRLCGPLGAAVTFAIAVAPVPLIIYLAGMPGLATML